MLQVIWSKSAVLKQVELENFLTHHYGEKVMVQFLIKLLNGVDLIAKNPEIGKKLDDQLRSFVLVKQISIIYVVSS